MTVPTPDTGPRALRDSGSAPCTVADLLRDGSRLLRGHDGQLAPRRLAEALLCALLNCRPLDCYADPGRRVPAAARERFQAGIRRLIAGAPLQYVTGFTLFMEHRFLTDARALIPRPETECLILTLRDQAGAWLRSRRQAMILDIGTGSGCILVSLALEHPSIRGIGIDISPAALQLAAANAHALGVRDRLAFLQGDGLTAVRPGRADIIVSNPPYVANADYRRLPRYIRDAEPPIALDGGTTGLTLINRLVGEASERLCPAGFLLIEIGHDQGPAVLQRFRAAGFPRPACVRDVAGRDRVVWARKP